MDKKSIVTGLVAGVALGLAGFAGMVQAADEPANIIKYRQSLMQSNTAHLAAFNAFARGQVTHKAGFAEMAGAMQAIGMQIPALFPAGSNTGEDNRSKPEIWSKKDDFTAAAKRLETEAGKLVQVAKGNDDNAIKAQIAVVSQACGGCHETFRTR